MHYIIGAKFVAPAPANTVHTGVTQISRGPKATVGQYRDKFKPGTTYSLFNIQQTKDKKYAYTFTEDGHGSSVTIEFNSPGEGYEFIAMARG